MTVVVRFTFLPLALAVATLFVESLFFDSARPPEEGDVSGLAQGFETCADVKGCTNQIDINIKINNFNINCETNAPPVKLSIGGATGIHCVDGDIHRQTVITLKEGLN